MRPTFRSNPATLRPFAAALLASLLLLPAGCKRKQTSSTGKPVAAPNTAKYADAISPMLSTQQLPFLRWPGIADFQAALATFYNNRDLQLAWSRDGKPTSQATALIDAFTHADQKGLRPDDYDAPRWPDRIHALSSGDHQAVAQFDVSLTIAAMRYMSDLHLGRVLPQHFSFEIDTASKRLDWPQFLNDNVLENSDVPSVLKGLEPDSDDYRKTLDSLHHYQDLAKQQADTPADDLPDPGRNLSPGDHYTAAPALRARLSLEGLLAADPGSTDADSSAPTQPASAARLTQADSDAVKLYQQLHGISPDGKLGSTTVKSLNVPMATRVHQLELALERWRWLPDPYLKPRLLVNLPEFLLRGYSPDPAHQLDFKMRIVVGKVKGDHDTPVFVHMMKYLIFRPFWNVPISIVKKELVGHVESNPAYLEEKGYEVRGRSGQTITGYTPGSLEHGGYLIRMKPGPSNALGLIKFMFPNQYDIYLHSTPEVGLFGRNRRDFSHGCIRVQHPDDLAVWVLQGLDDPKTHDAWTLDNVNEAMQTGEDNRTINLKTPLPIDIYYLTAFVNEDNQTEFFDDLYSYDADLDTALQHGPPYPTKPLPPKPKAEPGDTV